ncbi:MAG: hypothetical protein APF77_09485 [Clostridia bacterium BRH_c25]|nr:MAG: hypothetical protein APF77_09485 [Clostridia bacterium BRH_c25]
MPVGIEAYNSFERNIEKAVNALRGKDYSTAQEYIGYAMLENNHAPEVHNLLGILAELTEDLSLAGKHYRAANALDPTYKPASKNLERITSFYYRVGNVNPDFGDKPEEEETIPYVIEYDDKNIGHFRRKEQVK